MIYRIGRVRVRLGLESYTVLHQLYLNSVKGLLLLPSSLVGQSEAATRTKNEDNPT